MPTKKLEMRIDILYRMMVTNLHLEDDSLVLRYLNLCLNEWSQLESKDKDFINRAHACIIQQKEYK
jgi:hypothetical protein